MPMSLIRFRVLGLLAAATAILAILPAQAQPKPTRDDVVRLDAQAIRLRNAGRYANAIKQHYKAIEAAKSVWGADHWDVAPVMSNLSETYRLDWPYDKAIPLAEEALKRYRTGNQASDEGGTYVANRGMQLTRDVCDCIRSAHT